MKLTSTNRLVRLPSEDRIFDYDRMTEMVWTWIYGKYRYIYLIYPITTWERFHHFTWHTHARMLSDYYRVEYRKRYPPVYNEANIKQLAANIFQDLCTRKSVSVLTS